MTSLRQRAIDALAAIYGPRLERNPHSDYEMKWITFDQAVDALIAAGLIRDETPVTELALAYSRAIAALGTAASDLDDAAEELASWGDYAPEWAKDKHDLAGCVENIATAAKKAHRAASAEGGDS